MKRVARGGGQSLGTDPFRHTRGVHGLRYPPVGETLRLLGGRPGLHIWNTATPTHFALEAHWDLGAPYSKRPGLGWEEPLVRSVGHRRVAERHRLKTAGSGAKSSCTGSDAVCASRTARASAACGPTRDITRGGERRAWAGHRGRARRVGFTRRMRECIGTRPRASGAACCGATQYFRSRVRASPPHLPKIPLV